jgi:hypothetical protein
MSHTPYVSVILDAYDVEAAVVSLNPGDAEIPPFPLVVVAGITLMAADGADLAAVLRRLADRVDEVVPTS